MAENNNNHANNKQKLEQQLWNIANTLRGKMGADEFRDYILGFIFYKYLSEKMHRYANEVLDPDSIKYREINEKIGISTLVGYTGILNHYRGNFNTALSRYKESLRIKEELGDMRGIARTLSNMGVIYKNRSDFESAMRCYERSVDINLELGDKEGLATTFGNMGILHKRAGAHP